MNADKDEVAVSRRGFLVISGAASLPIAVTAAATAEERPIRREVKLKVNGRSMSAALEPRVTLLDVLRERAGLTGTKKGCNEGAWGPAQCWLTVSG